MVVKSREYICTNFKHQGSFRSKVEVVTAPKLIFRLGRKGYLLLLEVNYGLYADASDGASLEFDILANIAIDPEGRVPDPEQLSYLVLDAAENAYKCLYHEFNNANKPQVLPPKPKFLHTNILSGMEKEVGTLLSWLNHQS